MTPIQLWASVTGRLRDYLEANVRMLLTQLTPTVDQSLLGGRLLSVVTAPDGNPIVRLLREIAGALDTGAPLRIHGWRRAPNADLGLALVLTDPDFPDRLAVVALTPGAGNGPIIDVVVMPGAPLNFRGPSANPWSATATITAQNQWEASFGPGMDPGPTAGTATIHVERKARFQIGMTTGPGMRMQGFSITLEATQAAPTSITVNLTGLEISLLSEEVSKLVGAAPGNAAISTGSGPVSVSIVADHLNGIRFSGNAGVRLNLPLRVKAPGLQGRGTAATLFNKGQEMHLGLVTSLTSNLPGLPLRAFVDNAGFSLPVVFPPDGLPRLGLAPVDIAPDGIGVDLTLPPVSGGGVVRHLPGGGFGGVIAMDLGVIAVQAVAQFRAPDATRSTTSFLVMLGIVFPPPGIQLSFGFALDAVGGLVGINHRVDVTALRQLVSDGNADRVLFPDKLVERAAEVMDALSGSFPPAGGRFVIAPMVRITWGGRMVSLAGALILELPAPVQAIVLGRLLVGIPDPVVPLIRLQASVLGRFDPDVPLFEMLVSLAGSWIVGLTVRGEIYLLVRGGDNPEFVLSAGGFHPRYVRPARVPVLQRLQMDLAPGAGYGMRFEAYLAVTSNAVQFGGQLHLQAMVAGCGIEGWLGLDALFRFEPTFAFAVAIRAGIAVRAFGHRLASVGLAFTLEGPAPWHAFGVGSVSVLFWDACLDFDIRWGSPPAVSGGVQDDRLPADIAAAIREAKAWVAERPQSERTGLTFTQDAAREMAEGMLVHPDATLRVTQAVVPLDCPITRYNRQHVAEQTWTITAVQLHGSPEESDNLDDLVDRFVRGEFFDLSEDAQLTAPPAVVHHSGKRVKISGLDVGPAHRMDDGYETAYEPPLQPKHRLPRWRARYGDEVGYRWLAAERLARWRQTAGPAAVALRPPRLRTVGGQGLHTLAATVATDEVASDAVPKVDVWQVMHEQGLNPAIGTRFLESWEVPS
jgi:hypothetical protein